MKQIELAKQLGISKSYLSMILSGQRQCPPELAEKLQSTGGIHKIVNNQLWMGTGSQKVVGSNPISSTNPRQMEESGGCHFCDYTYPKMMEFLQCQIN